MACLNSKVAVAFGYKSLSCRLLCVNVHVWMVYSGTSGKVKHRLIVHMHMSFEALSLSHTSIRLPDITLIYIYYCDHVTIFCYGLDSATTMDLHIARREISHKIIIYLLLVLILILLLFICYYLFEQ